MIQANSADAKQVRPTLPGYNGLSEAFGNAVSRVLQGEGEPAEATPAGDRPPPTRHSVRARRPP